MTRTDTILIVDDNPLGREALEDLLFGQGYSLHFAASGLEALQKAAAVKPELILLDIMMPGMDGFEVCRRLRADPELAYAAVLLVTALDDSATQDRGAAAGADDFITKPFNRSELRARIREMVRKGRERRPASSP